MFINHSPLTSSWNLQLQAQGSFGKVFHFWITHLELWLVGWLVGRGYPDFLGQHVMSARWETSIRLGVFWGSTTPFWVAEQKPQKCRRVILHPGLVGNFATVLWWEILHHSWWENLHHSWWLKNVGREYFHMKNLHFCPQLLWSIGLFQSPKLVRWKVHLFGGILSCLEVAPVHRYNLLHHILSVRHILNPRKLQHTPRTHPKQSPGNANYERNPKT